MLNHLRGCEYHKDDPNLQKWADTEFRAKYYRGFGRSSVSTPRPLPIIFHPSSSHFTTQGTSSLPFQQFPPSPFYPQPGYSPQLPLLEMSNQSPALVVGAPIPAVPHSPYIDAMGFAMQASPGILPNQLPSRPPSSLSSYLQSPSISRPPSQVPRSFDQHNFNMCIGRMTVAAGLPISWTDNPEVRSVFRIFLPWAQLPSWKTLSRSVLPTLQNNLRTQSQKEARESNCTLQCDGWTGISMHHLIAFMITIWPKVCTCI